MSTNAYAQSNAELGVASIGLVVSDISESEQFYKDVIGMKELWKFSLDEEWSDEAGASMENPFRLKCLHW